MAATWLAATAALVMVGCGRDPETSGPSPSELAKRQFDAKVAQLEARERQMDETVWAKEMLAQKCGRVFEDLWDSINASTNKLEVAAAFGVGQVLLSISTRTEARPHDVLTHEPSAASRSVLSNEWGPFLASFQQTGWRLDQVEFRHTQFVTSPDNQPSESRVYFSANLINTSQVSRATIEGDLKVFWQEGQIDPIARIKAIDATQLSIRVRPGEPAFKLAIFEQLLPLRNSRSIDPLLVYDLNGDGLPEIILASRNVVYRRFPDGHYGSESLCRYPTDVVYVALIGDFDGDGVPDFLAEDYSGLQLFKGSRQGRFETPGRLVWRAGREIQYPMMLTAGDIDEDGDLDLFLAQYKLPYEGGQMPAPYYDANDGYPSFLLLNDGRGRWLDATERSGLSGKRWRRTYSASIADVDGDGHLDLVVVSDFAGVDCYRNNGKGRFEDVTRTWFPEPRVFGMALAMADFNQDAALDLLVTGMPSPTADRLEHLSLWRPDSHEDRQMRARVTKGNRLYMRQPTGQFEETSLAANLARSGWSWGCAAFDADNDGFPEIYVANGMESTQSVRDYEGQFWLHDIYVGGSTEDPVVNAYLRAKVARMRSQGESFGGHELNRFYWNDHGKQFLEAGHLFGLALEEDSRNVVATDVDGDGRLDIIVTSYAPWPSRFQNLRVYENRLTGTGNWIDFRFDDSSGETLSGLRITLSTSDGPRVGQIVFGDSYRSQHPSVIHFGLGIKERIDQAIIQWPSGRRTALERPAVNQHHLVSPPAR